MLRRSAAGSGSRLPCYSPQPVYLTPAGWRFAPRRAKVFNDIRQKYVSCKNCIGCRLERSRQWAVRSVHEAQYHDENYFLTLTFNDKHLPADGSLNTRTLQNFWKKVRKASPSQRFKYYAAGEYGDNYGRPHYHASTFGLNLSDLRPSFKSSSGYQMYASPSLEAHWGNGAVYIAPLTFETAAYTARYICKKITGKNADAHYKKLGLLPERSWPSKGLGKKWFEDYAHETYRDNYIIVRGVPSVPPAAYTRWLKISDPDTHSRYEIATGKSYEEQTKIIEDLISGQHDVARVVKEASLRAGRLDQHR